MKIIQKGKLFHATFNTHTSKPLMNHVHLLVGESVAQVRKMLKKEVSKALKKINSNTTLVLNEGYEIETMYYVDTMYSNYDAEDSEFITYTKYRVSKYTKRKIELSRKVVRNPDFVDNPECGFCYKKVVELFDDVLLDDKETPVEVCKKCKSDLKMMRGLVEVKN